MPSNHPGWTPNLRLLTEALTSATTRLRQPESPSTYENDFAAASLLMKLLGRATSLRIPLDRAHAVQVIHAAGSQADVANLEQRSLIRFPLGWLHLPRAVRMELLRRAHKPDEDRTGQSLDEKDEAALRALQDEMPDSADWNWISTAELDAIRQVHFAAHPLTPSAESLCEQGLLSSWLHGETAGYRIHLHGYRSGEQWQPVVGHALALLWRELLRNDAFADDPTRLRHWLAIAPEAYAVHEAPAFLETGDKERLLDACTTLLLAPEEAATPTEEIDRLRFEFGLSVRNDHAPRLPPDDASNLLAQYEWRNGPEAGPAGHLEVGEIDRLIMLVLGYDDAFGAPRAMQLVEGSVRHPYLLPATTSRHSPALVTGLLANPKTVALGMKLLSEIHIVDNARWSLGNYTNSREEQERERMELWRKGVGILVDTCLPGLHARDPEVIEQVSEVLGLTASAAASLANSAQAANERACAEMRLTALLTALERLPNHALERLFAHFPEYLERRAAARRQKYSGSQQMPVPELRLAFWWLQVAGCAGLGEGSESIQAAETILKLYRTELKRETTPDGEAVYWLNDVPSAAQLPWHELALVLQRAGRLADLLKSLSG